MNRYMVLMFSSFFYVKYWYRKENEVLRSYREAQYCKALVLATTKSKVATVFSDLPTVS